MVWCVCVCVWCVCVWCMWCVWCVVCVCVVCVCGVYVCGVCVCVCGVCMCAGSAARRKSAFPSQCEGKVVCCITHLLWTWSRGLFYIIIMTLSAAALFALIMAIPFIVPIKCINFNCKNCNKGLQVAVLVQ